MKHKQWLAELLLLPTIEQQILFLEEANLLNEDALGRVLDLAMKEARSQPARARQLTSLCSLAARQASASAIIPRATYISAQTVAINGEFDKALVLIKEARAAYEALGHELSALRTNAGLIHVLNELGQHEQALNVAHETRQLLRTTTVKGEPKEIKMLVALTEQNKGVCYELTGNYEEALKAYAAAESTFAALAMPERMADLSNNRGTVLVSLGRGRCALLAFEAAASIRQSAGLTLLYAQTQSNIGEAHLMMGNYTRSLEALGEADALFSQLKARSHQHILLLHTANAYLALNLYPEALRTYREAARLLQDAGMSTRLAHVLLGMGAALIREGLLSEASSVLTQAATLFTKADNLPMISTVLLEQAALQDARGEREKAQKTAQLALATVADEQKWPVEQIVALLRLADLLPEKSALPHLMAARSLLDTLSLPPLEYRLNQRLGRLHLLNGELQEAQNYLEKAVMQIEELRGTLAQEALRTSFLQDKTAAYEDLIVVHLRRGNQRDAFGIAEQAKSRALLDLLAGASRGRDHSKIANLSQLQSDLSAIYNQFLSPNQGQLGSLQAAAIELEQQIRHLRLQGVNLEDDDPFFTPLLPDDAPRWGGELAQLTPGLVLLTYHIVGDEILAFVATRHKLSVVRALSSVLDIQTLLQRLNIQWDRFRAGRTFAKRHLKQLERSTVRVLAALYQNLVMPLEPLIGEAEKMVIVPHGVLHQVPFHALHDGKQYLIDRFIISYAPSASVFTICRKRSLPRQSSLVVGVPDALIPAVDKEVKAVAEQLKNRPVKQLQAEEATLAALRAHAPKDSLLHLACHGLFRADNPMFSALKLYDGWLTAADVMSLDLTNTLVTLSACESGRSQVILGDEVIGLPRAFLGAGAATLVVTLWLVQDQTTAILMENWYKALRTKSPAAALRTAQLALKAEYPHPYYWAPFVLIGKRD